VNRKKFGLEDGSELVKAKLNSDLSGKSYEAECEAQ